MTTKISLDNIQPTALTEIAGGGVTAYSTIASLPLSNNTTGDLAFVSENNRLYLWNSAGWYNIALINTSPSITGGNESSYIFETDGTPIEITLIGSDPEGIPLTWSYEVTSGSLTNGGGTTATVSNVDNVFTITPSTNLDYAGSFSLTFKASDGVNIGTTVSSFALTFLIINSKYTTLLAKGTLDTQNATFLDESTNNHTITANGDVYQGTFSPYRSGGYSMYFDGTGDYITVESSSDFAFGTGDFTVEGWVYFTAFNATANGVFQQATSYFNTSSSNSLAFATLNTSNFQIYAASGGLKSFNPPVVPQLNTWYHFALVRNSGTTTAYLNGTARLTIADTQDYTGTYFGVGSIYGTTYNQNGYITNVRVVKGTAVYTSNFTPPTDPLTAITNTSLLINTPYIADSSSNAHTITVSGNASTQPFSPFDYKAYDDALNGGSAYFDGTGDSLFVPSSSDFAYGTGDFTWEVWIYPTLASWASSNTYIIDHGSNGGTLSYYGDSLKYYNPATATGSPLYTGAALVAPNTWTHIAAARESGTTRVFVNGILTKSGSDSNNFTAQALTVGGWGGGAGYYFQGYISDLRLIKGTAVYTSDFTPPTAPLTAITNTSLLLNFTNAGIQDYSQVSDLKTVGNATGSNTQTKYAAYSMYFDGTGDYITVNHDALGTGNWTIEGWIYFNSISSQYIFDFRTAGNTNPALDIQNDWRYITDNAYRISSGVIPSANTWYHFAVVKNNGTTTLYIDGSSIGTYTDSLNYVGNSVAQIGKYHGGASNYFNGYVEDLRITKGLARYTANFTPPTTELLG